MKLREVWYKLVKKYSKNLDIIDKLWKQIEKNYSSPKRYYHNLTHIEYMVDKMEQISSNLSDKDGILFAIFYHDIVYDVKKGNNEEKSGEIAYNSLKRLNLTVEEIERIKGYIIATKGHKLDKNSDINYLLDIDLLILGDSEENYDKYCKNIREEYYIYSDLEYKIGRKKVINHFLTMDHIYKTDLFYKMYENRAHNNLKRELVMLNN